MSAEVKTSFDHVIREAEQELDAEKRLKAELTEAAPHKATELAEQNIKTSLLIIKLLQFVFVYDMVRYF